MNFLSSTCSDIANLAMVILCIMFGLLMYALVNVIFDRSILCRKPVSVSWVIANIDGTKYRTWATGIPRWTTDISCAIRLARRRDAEELCQEDEDAWLILAYTPKETPNA